MPPPPSDSGPLAAEAIKLLQNVWGVCDPSAADSTLHDQEPNTWAHLATPAHVGRYEDLELIGAGGYGLVFSARDPMIGRRVALKIPRPEFAFQPEARARFLDEARLAGSLNHPGIVQVFEAGEQGGFWYLATELCDGPDLAEWLKSQSEPISARATASLTLQVCQAIGAAHAQGIIHRDLKPGNILLVHQPTPGSTDQGDALPGGWILKVTDFGLAKLLEGGSELTRTGAAAGTPQYMAPEQTWGKTASPATDIWAIGVILYEMLVGFPPFRSEGTLETMRLIHDVEPVPPRRLRAGVPADLETICLKCLEKEPSHRYASTADLAEDLSRYLTGRTILAKPAGAFKRTWRWCQRNRLVASLAVVLVFTLIAGTVTSSYLAILWRGEAVLALRHANHADELRIASDAQSFDALLAEARATRRQGGSGQRVKSLKAIRKALTILEHGELPDQDIRKRELTNELLSSLVLPDLVVDQELPCGEDTLPYGAIDREFQRYAYATLEGEVTVRNTDDHAIIFQAKHPKGFRTRGYPILSRDGKYIAVIYDRIENDARSVGKTVHVWSIDDGPGPIIESLVYDYRGIDFSPTSSHIAIGRGDGKIIVYDLISRMVTEEYISPALDSKLNLTGIANVRFDPTGEYIGAANYKSELVNVFHRSAKRLAYTQGGQTKNASLLLRDFAWSRQTSALVTMSYNGSINHWYVPDLEHYGYFRARTGVDVRFGLGPSGDYLVTYDRDGYIELHRMPLGESLVRAPAGELYSPYFSQDGSRVGLTFGGNGFQTWQIHLPRSAMGFPLRSSLPIESCHRYSGRYIALQHNLDRQHRIELWDTLSGTRSQFIPVPHNITSLESDGSGNLYCATREVSGDCKIIKYPYININKWGDPELIATLELGEESKGQPATRVRSAVQLINQSEYAVHYIHQTAALYKTNDIQHPPFRLEPDFSPHGTIAVSPCEKYVVASSILRTGTHVYCISSGELVALLSTKNFTAYAFSNNGKWLATNDGRCRLWSVGDWAEGPQLPKESRHRKTGIAFHPNNDWLITCDGINTIRFLNLNNTQDQYDLQLPYEVTGVYCSPDGRNLSVHHGNTELSVINLNTLAQECEQYGLIFSPGTGNKSTLIPVHED